jgi:hypothetical protein
VKIERMWALRRDSQDERAMLRIMILLRGTVLMANLHLFRASIAICLLASFALCAAAQAPAASSAPPAPASPAQSVGLYVFPQKNQTAAVQQQDENSCYSASIQASGVDPRNPPTTVVQVQQSSGGGARGAARGAAGGAAIGAIAGDAGTGAAAGAVVGVVRGHRAQKQANADAEAQAQQQAAAIKQQNIDAFKRAMTACLESRSYSVK